MSLTHNEKIAVVVGGAGLAYFLFAPKTAAASVLAKPPATSPSTLASLLKALGSAGNAFGIGTPGGAGPSSSGAGSSSPGSFNVGPSWDDFNNNTDNGLNADGTIASGPLSFSDGTTVDLNLIDPDTGMQYFQVPTQDGDSSGFIQDAEDNPPADFAVDDAGDDGTDTTTADPTPVDDYSDYDWSAGGDGGGDDGF